MTRTFTTAAALALLLPSTASAHGIGEDATGRSTLEFVPLGIEHMLLGWDHLLFIAGVVLIAGGVRRSAKLISLFALGHSLTLIIATLAGWKLNATVVDAIIALSVVYVGYLGLKGAGDRHDWRQVSAVVFGFGLVHGLGLSTRLQDLGLSSDGLLGKVIAFNIGVELGQITAIIVMIGIGSFVARQLKDPYSTQRYASAALIPLGLLAGLVLAASGGAEKTSQPVADRTGGPATTTPADTTANAQACTAAEHEPAVFAGGAHPGASFMEPGATYNEVDLIHVITDGYLVVRYNPDLETQRREEIRSLVENSDDTILAVPDPKVTGAYAVVASRRTLTCPDPDINAATTFAAQWIDDVRAGNVKP